MTLNSHIHATRTHTHTHSSSVVKEDGLSTGFFSHVHLIKNLAMDGLQSMLFKMEAAVVEGRGGDLSHGKRSALEFCLMGDLDFLIEISVTVNN